MGMKKLLSLFGRATWTHVITVQGQRAASPDGGSKRELHYVGESVELRMGANEWGNCYALFENGRTGYFPFVYLRKLTPEPEPPPEPPPAEFTPYAELKVLAADGNWYLYRLVGKVE